MYKQVSLLVAIAALFQISTASAHGAAFEKDIPDQSSTRRHLKVEFKANTENPELARAWLFAYYDQTTMSEKDGSFPQSTEIVVPGLSYSATNKQIVYKKADGSSVVCVDKVDGDHLTKASYHETGKCSIDLSKTTINQDNGFHIKNSPAVKISFNIHE